MIKKSFIILLLCCFLSNTISMNALSFYDGLNIISNRSLQDKIAEFRQKHFQTQREELRELVFAYKTGEIELNEKEVEEIKGRILFNLKEAFEELKKPENEKYLQFMQEVAVFLPSPYREAINEILSVISFPGSMEAKIESLDVTFWYCNIFVVIEYFWLFCEFLFFYVIGWPKLGRFSFLMLSVSAFMWILCVINAVINS